MKIKLKTNYASLKGTAHMGDVIDTASNNAGIDEEQAHVLLRTGHAFLYEETGRGPLETDLKSAPESEKPGKGTA